MKKIFIILIFLFLFSLNGIASDVPTRFIEDDSVLRISLLDSWFRESPGTVLSRPSEIHTLRNGTRIQVRVDSSGQNREEFAIVLAREQNGSFPGWAQGSWVYTRRRDNDINGSRIRIFLRSDFNTYIQFRPFGSERSMMDVVIYDGYVVRSHPIPIPFERILVLPVEDVLSAAGNYFPRHYFDPDPNMYRDTRNFVRAVRSSLNETGMAFVDDGAIDERGNFVFIDSLDPQELSANGVNCSGFAKWVVDGILRPITGQRLPITPLKEPFGERGASFTDPWEELHDPFFGLDWSRNLASIAGATLRSSTFGNLDEIEVRSRNFSHIISRQAGGSTAIVYPGFTEIAGYGFEGLQALMYTLAIDEPNRIYLAAINTETMAQQIVPPRAQPRTRQFFHVAVLIPFFNENGVFQVAVFESAAETSFTRFRTRYGPDHFVNLVRIPIEGNFNP
ncbi:MAG: hypothetical protein FWG77_11750 [Treponema sp.]|nr:hypothetical protein [Treponema sp.]